MNTGIIDIIDIFIYYFKSKTIPCLGIKFSKLLIFDYTFLYFRWHRHEKFLDVYVGVFAGRVWEIFSPNNCTSVQSLYYRVYEPFSNSCTKDQAPTELSDKVDLNSSASHSINKRNLKRRNGSEYNLAANFNTGHESEEGLTIPSYVSIPPPEPSDDTNCISTDNAEHLKLLSDYLNLSVSTSSLYLLLKSLDPHFQSLRLFLRLIFSIFESLRLFFCRVLFFSFLFVHVLFSAGGRAHARSGAAPVAAGGAALFHLFEQQQHRSHNAAGRVARAHLRAAAAAPRLASLLRAAGARATSECRRFGAVARRKVRLSRTIPPVRTALYRLGFSIT